MKLADYLEYPIGFKKDDDGITIQIVGLDGAITEAKEGSEIQSAAISLFVDFAEFLLRDGVQVPEAERPKKGQPVVRLPAVVAIKVMLRNAMLQKDVSQYALAKMLGTTPQSVNQSLTLSRKATSLDTLMRALEAIGCRVSFAIE